MAYVKLFGSKLKLDKSWSSPGILGTQTRVSEYLKERAPWRNVKSIEAAAKASKAQRGIQAGSSEADSHQHLSVSEAARNLGIHPNLLRKWKERVEEENEDTSLTEDEGMEMARLRAENRRLRIERNILKKAAAFFANEKN